MGLDQRIWADIEVGSVKRSVAIHYWRKDYEVDEFFYRRLSFFKRLRIARSESPSGWTCDITPNHLNALEANDYAVALEIGFDMELIERCREALNEGFSLTYCRDS